MMDSHPFLIQEHVSLKDKNWFKTGGSARYYCEPATAQEFQQALTFAKHNALEIFLLGEGANVLINDAGFDGLVIHPKTVDPVIHPTQNGYGLVTCSAGLSMNILIEKTLDAHLTGLEVFSGIPGTVGGSAYINLHYFTHFLSDFIVSGHVIEKATGKVFEVDLNWFNYGYNKSTLIAGNHYLIDLTLRLTKGTEVDAAYAKGRRFEIIRHRTSRYPNANTCGSFFRNFYENEVTIVKNGKKMIFVAFYLDKIGVKGTETSGGACVSYQHANMLVTSETATSQDVVNLARTLQGKVWAEFGIIPQPECILVGFKTNPLLSEQSIAPVISTTSPEQQSV